LSKNPRTGPNLEFFDIPQVRCGWDAFWIQNLRFLSFPGASTRFIGYSP
jgi:hypothetical protein